MMYYKSIDDKEFFSDGKILKLETGFIINPTEELMLEAGWSVYNEPEPTDEQKLLIAKNNKIKEIENYDSSSAVEEFTINGTPMWLNHELRLQIRTSIEAYKAAGYDTMTKVFNNNEFTFSISLWIDMINALEIYASEALNTTERHKNNINRMDNIEDINNYDYTTNYPSKLEFNS